MTNKLGVVFIFFSLLNSILFTIKLHNKTIMRTGQLAVSATRNKDVTILQIIRGSSINVVEPTKQNLPL